MLHSNGKSQKNGNTIQLVNPFMEEMALQGYDCEMVWLQDLKLEPCIACRRCQKDGSIFGCFHKDDMQEASTKYWLRI